MISFKRDIIGLLIVGFVLAVVAFGFQLRGHGALTVIRSLIPCHTRLYGVCADGAYDGNGSCVPHASPSAELCDGLDNDCDGTADEGCVCRNGVTQMCGSDIGVCSHGEMICSNGRWGVCSGIAPDREIYDGVDNDCDGETDEDPPI